MLPTQEKLILSEYSGIYDVIIKEDHWIRKLHDIIDYDFIYDELKDKYCLFNGAMAYNPIKLFKLLMLKGKYKLSDRDLIERGETDVGLATLFKTKTIIVDSTHTKSVYNPKSPIEILTEESKALRKTVYEIKAEYKDMMPSKPTSRDLDDHIKYCTELIDLLRSDEQLAFYNAVSEKINYLEEIVNDDIENKISLNDEEARIGHKTADTSFFGYKTHIAMSPERIITTAVVSTGDKADNTYTQELIEQSIESGYDVDILIGDGAYSGKSDLEYGKENNIKIVSKTNQYVYSGNPTASRCKGFTFNKDAGMYVCTAGHMAIKKVRNGGKKNPDKAQQTTFFFDVNKCKVCPYKDGCYSEGSKTKTYTHRLPSKLHQDQVDFQNSKEFKELYKERYKIEAKNSELKHSYGMTKTYTSGLFGMHLQSVISIFTSNLKRIITIENEKSQDNK